MMAGWLAAIQVMSDKGSSVRAAVYGHRGDNSVGSVGLALRCRGPLISGASGWDKATGTATLHTTTGDRE